MWISGSEGESRRGHSWVMCFAVAGVVLHKWQGMVELRFKDLWERR